MKLTDKMYKAYYGIGRKQLARLVYKEIYGIENNKSKMCNVWSKIKKIFKVVV
jgi:hypothetical protein